MRSACTHTSHMSHAICLHTHITYESCDLPAHTHHIRVVWSTRTHTPHTSRVICLHIHTTYESCDLHRIGYWLIHVQAEYIVEAMAREGMQVYSDHMTVMVLLRLHHTHFLFLLSRRAAHTAEEMSLSSFHVHTTMCALAHVCCTRSLLLSLSLSLSPFLAPSLPPLPTTFPSLSLFFSLPPSLSPSLFAPPFSLLRSFSPHTYDWHCVSRMNALYYVYAWRDSW